LNLLCTDSKKYRTERTLFQTTSKPVVALLASFLTSSFGLPVATAAGLASLALLLPVKMATGAWCRAHKNAKELDALEIETLQKLRQKKKVSTSGPTK
jgi:hypothetical protein